MAPARRGRHRRHPLRHPLDEARHQWRGVSLDTLLEDVETAADFAMVHSYGGYTTNLPAGGPARRQGLDRLRSTTGSRCPPSTAGRPGCWSRTCTSGSRAKWVHGLELLLQDEPGFWETARLPRLRRPVARAAVPGATERRAARARRRAWRRPLVERRVETPTARTLVLDVPRMAGPPGRPARRRPAHRRGRLPGRQRSYSLAAPADGDRIEMTVQRVARRRGLAVPDRGPRGRRPGRGARAGRRLVRLASRRTRAPVLLVAGGSGIVPLMAMIRARARGREPGAVPAGLLGARPRTTSSTPTSCAAERRRPRPRRDLGLHPRRRRTGRPRPAGRTPRTTSSRTAGRPTSSPRASCAGRPASSRAVADMLVELGHDPARIRTERFGLTGPPQKRGSRTMTADRRPVRRQPARRPADRGLRRRGRPRPWRGAAGAGRVLGGRRRWPSSAPSPGWSPGVPAAPTCCCALVRTPDAVWLDLGGISCAPLRRPGLRGGSVHPVWVTSGRPAERAGSVAPCSCSASSCSA